MSPVVVGVDGGGSGSRALVRDESGRELARLEGPSALVDPRDPGRAVEVVEGLVREAARAAGVPLPLDALWAGLAGAGRPQAREPVLRALRAAGLAHRVGVGTDSQAAFHDAFPGGAGILLVAGTGSVALGSRGDGGAHRAGGWGSLMGDEGSGYALGVAALRVVARAHDGRGPETALAGVLLEHLELDAPEALVIWAASAAKHRVAALAPLVVAAAGAGDRIAESLLDEAVEGLVELVRAVESALAPWLEPPEVALSGGLVAPSGPLRDRVEARIHEEGLTVSARPVDPAAGAAALALQLGSAATP